MGREHELSRGSDARLGRGVDGDDVIASRSKATHAGLGVEQPEALAQLATKLDQAAVELEQRPGVAALVVDVAFLRVDRRQPRLARS